MHKGKLKFFRGTHGYIACPEFRYTLYFTRADIRKDGRQWLKRGDDVEFVAIPDPQRKGRSKAINVLYTGFTPFTLEMLGVTVNVDELIIGELNAWNGLKGLITSSMLQAKDTFLYYSRVVNAEIKKGQFLVFKPVDSKDSRSTYFGYFAYPIELEKKNNLLQIYAKDGQNGYPELEPYIKTHFHQDWLIQQIKWATEDEWHLADTFCKEYKSRYGEINLETIGKLPRDFQFYAWERKYTVYINPDLLLNYFTNSPKEEKAYILSIVTIEQKNSLLESYSQWLVQTGKYCQISGYLKPLINLLKEFSSEKLRLVESIIFDKLNASDLIDLWINGYLARLPEEIDVLDYVLNSGNEFFKAFFDLDLKSEFNAGVYKSLEIKLLSGSSVLTSNEEIAKISFFLKWRYQQNKATYSLEVLPSLTNHYDWDILVLLMGLGVYTGDIFKTVPEPVLLRSNIVTRILLDVAQISPFNVGVTGEILANGLQIHHIVDGMCQFPWDDDFHPTQFLTNQYAVWHKKHELNSPAPDQLAVALFEKLLPANSVHHIRLYTHFFHVLNQKDVYYDFLPSFKKLNRAEKEQFRSVLKIMLEYEERKVQRETVLPCTDFKELGKDEVLYHATVSNIYFKDGSYQLRLKDGSYTQIKNDELVSAAFNMLGTNTKEGKIVIQIKVNNAEITDVDGLDIVISSIFQNFTKAILAKYPKINANYAQGEISYVQDFDLKKAIFAYLESMQLPGSVSINLKEYGVSMGRIKATTNKDRYSRLSHGKLFSISCEDGVAIVWENIEMEEALSTYVFKSPLSHYPQQLEKIKNAVSSLKNLRTYLTSTFKKDDDMDGKLLRQSMWRSYLGYIGNFKKRRGLKDGFSRWEKNFKEVLKEACPNVENTLEPDIYETESIFGAVIKVERNKKQSFVTRDKTVQQIDNLELGRVVSDESIPFTKDPITEMVIEPNDQSPADFNRLLNMHQSLQILNQNFLKTYSLIMTAENNAAETIQALVDELNRLKKAAQSLEEARLELSSFKSENDSHILLIEKQMSAIKSLTDQQANRQTATSNDLVELNDKSDRLEKWLKIEMENIYGKIADFESHLLAITEKRGEENEIHKRTKSNNGLIWIAICWLSTLTILLGIYYYRHR